MTAAALIEESASAPQLHQPKRALIAVAELVLIVLLVAAAYWCWGRGIQRFSYPMQSGPPLLATRYHGNWIATAVGLVTLAGVLLLDALRQTLLAVRTKARKPPKDA